MEFVSPTRAGCKSKPTWFYASRRTHHITSTCSSCGGVVTAVELASIGTPNSLGETQECGSTIPACMSTCLFCPPPCTAALYIPYEYVCHNRLRTYTLVACFDRLLRAACVRILYNSSSTWQRHRERACLLTGRRNRHRGHR